MTMLTHSEVEFEFDFDPCIVADQLCGGAQPVDEMEACRSLCDAIGREFADAAFELLCAGTLGWAVEARTLLGRYRVRGNAVNTFGELKTDLDPPLSSSARPRSHIQGRPVECKI